MWQLDERGNLYNCLGVVTLRVTEIQGEWIGTVTPIGSNEPCYSVPYQRDQCGNDQESVRRCLIEFVSMQLKFALNELEKTP